MNKIWYILIDGKEEGPYSVQGLKNHPLVTPDTLVRHKDSKKWQPIRYVKELEEIFKDEPEEIALKPAKELPGRDVLAIDMRYDPTNLFWLIILILAIAYVIFKLNSS